MKPIKIIQIFTVLNKGGAETNLMNYYRNMERNEFQMDFLVVGDSASFEFFIGSSMIPRSIFLPVSGPPTPAQTYVPLWLAMPNSSVLRFTATPSAGLLPSHAPGNMLRYSGVDIIR